MLRPIDEEARHYYGVLESDVIVRVDRDGPQPVIREGAASYDARISTALSIDDLKPVEDEVQP